MSMNRAAALARSDADKKVKEAALARKRARDMLDRSLTISEMEKDKNTKSVEIAVTPIPASSNMDSFEPKIKASRVRYSVSSDAAAQKRTQDREREKWKRFSEPIGSFNSSLMVVNVNEKIKEHLNSNVAPTDEKKKKNIFASGSPTGISDQE